MMRERRVDLFLRLVVLTAALAVPLAFQLHANEVFELPKSTVLKVLGGLAAAALVWRGGVIRSRAAVGAAAFLGLCALSMARTPLAQASRERLGELGALAVLLVAAEAGLVARGKLITVAMVA